MSIRNIFQAISILFALMMLFLAFIFWQDLNSALEMSNHTLNSLGYVLAGRFVASAGLALFVAFYRDLKVMSAAFAIFAWMALIDGYTYFSQGLPHWGHTGTGIFLVLVLAGLQYYRMRNPEASST